MNRVVATLPKDKSAPVELSSIVFDGSVCFGVTVSSSPNRWAYLPMHGTGYAFFSIKNQKPYVYATSEGSLQNEIERFVQDNSGIEVFMFKSTKELCRWMGRKD